MAVESAKKRKRSRDDPSEKEPSIEGDRPTSTGSSKFIKIAKVLKPKVAPVVAVGAGVNLPGGLDFHTYEKVNNLKASKKWEPRSKKKAASEIILHSTSHPSLDYTLSESQPKRRKRSAPATRHYIGIFDPKTGKVDVIEAKKMIVRATVRAQNVEDESVAAKTEQELNIEVTEQFGSKKSRKALKDRVENAVTLSGLDGKLNKSDRAVLSYVEKGAEDMATAEDLQAVVDQNRPVPRRNYHAKVVQDVYIPEDIVGKDEFNAIPIMDWQESLKAEEELSLESRFVARRITRLGNSEDPVRRLRTMRYLLWMIVLWLVARPGPQPGTKRIAQDRMRENMRSAPESILRSLYRKFSDDGVMRKMHIDLLMTHICAFACIIDNFEVNLADLMQDLKQQVPQTKQYFLEIGARYSQKRLSPRDPTQHIAKLSLPLEFPGIRKPRERRRAA